MFLAQESFGELGCHDSPSGNVPILFRSFLFRAKGRIQIASTEIAQSVLGNQSGQSKEPLLRLQFGLGTNRGGFLGTLCSNDSCCKRLRRVEPKSFFETGFSEE